MECISSIVTCLCGRLSDGLGGAVQEQTEVGFSSLIGLAGRALLDRVRERQNKVIPQLTDTTTLVGAEESLKAIRSHLLGNEVDVVGIVGMGGVGKTTLLKKINNDFYSGGAANFNIIMFVTVSSEGDAPKVKKKIAERLGQPEGAISDALRGKRYLLLLDDVWGELDLSEIGVPFPNEENKCKIALTTRSREVFDSFLDTWCRPRSERARVVDVRKLDEARSWELFRSMVGHPDLDDPCIAPHAEKMVQKCDGLPLALVTVGKTMSRATLAAQWREAETQWETSPYHLHGMNKVKSSLMFSIDRLKEQGTLPLLPCLLYCSLFPEDYDIDERELIEYWIGEGFLDGGDKGAPHQRGGEGVYGSLGSARDKGEIVIKNLKDLCLLETGTSRGCVMMLDIVTRGGFLDSDIVTRGGFLDTDIGTRGGCVKMHDLVREVALELSSGEPNRFLVHAFDSDFPRSNPINIVDDEWEKATRVLLMNCRIESLPEMPRCRKMSTLLMLTVVTRVLPVVSLMERYLPDGFFTSMRNLVVLNLSFSLAHTVPTSICLLSELRFLSLRWTPIRSLPKELGNLVKLRQLDLSWTFELKEIPQQAILGLSNLQVLNMIGCGYYEWGLGGESSVDDAGNNGDMQLSVSDLDGMTQLQDFRINVFRLGFLLDSLFNRIDSVLTSITELTISDIGGLTTNTLQSALQRMTNLRRLTISCCKELTGELILDGNAHKPMLSELEELTLSELPLSAITIMRDGINGEGGDNSGYKRLQRQWGGPLQKLKRLKLTWLPNLQRICDDPPQNCLPSLEYLDVDDCPLLRTLPLVPIQKLKRLSLGGLPNLQRICDDTPQNCLPSLEYLEVFRCPLLRTLPLGPHSKIKEIWCHREWWERLQWRRDQRDARRTAELAAIKFPRPGT